MNNHENKTERSKFNPTITPERIISERNSFVVSADATKSEEELNAALEQATGTTKAEIGALESPFGEEDKMSLNRVYAVIIESLKRSPAYY